MPYNDPDPEDPNVLVGMELQSDEDTDEEMAHIFVQEFKRIGFDSEQIFRLFRNPFYFGANKAYEKLGKEKIRQIIAEYEAIWNCKSRPQQEQNHKD